MYIVVAKVEAHERLVLLTYDYLRSIIIPQQIQTYLCYYSLNICSHIIDSIFQSNIFPSNHIPITRSREVGKPNAILPNAMADYLPQDLVQPTDPRQGHTNRMERIRWPIKQVNELIVGKIVEHRCVYLPADSTCINDRCTANPEAEPVRCVTLQRFIK